MTKKRIRELREHARKVECNGTALMLTECLTEIENLQRFTRRGQEPQVEPDEVLPPAAKGKGSKADPRTQQFIDGWVQTFKQFHGIDYCVQGAKDGSAAKRLVKMKTVDQLLDLAWDAWHGNRNNPRIFSLKNALTIAGFASMFNAIQVDLKQQRNPTTQTEPEHAKTRL